MDDFERELEEIIKKNPPASHWIPKDYKMADTFYEQLEKDIKTTEQGLGPDDDLHILYFQPNGEPIRIQTLGYHNPFTILLAGRDAGNNKCEVLAHMNTVQLVLKVMKGQSQNRIPIGFKGNQQPPAE